MCLQLYCVGFNVAPFKLRFFLLVQASSTVMGRGFLILNSDRIFFSERKFSTVTIFNVKRSGFLTQSFGINQALKGNESP